MSDDLNNKIKQIASVLGQDNLPDNVAEMISAFASSMGKSPEGTRTSSEATPKASEPPKFEEEKGSKNDLEDSMEMFRKVQSVMQRLNTNNDPRINLLTAIRPFLNKKRQSSLSNCIKLINMSAVARLFDEGERR